MKRHIYSLIISSLLFSFFSTHVLAAITEQEANEVLAEKGWDQEKFQQFLHYYELTLNDFDSKEDLSTMIGTPITEESLNRLLADYGLARKDLDELLGEFGMTIEDHWSIEELDASIEFYINNQENIDELEDFIEAIGVTEEESNKLFKHFEDLDQTELEEKMEKISARLDSLLMLDPEAELTDAQLNEVVSIWKDVMNIINIYPKFYLVDGNTKKAVNFRTLASMNEFPSDALLIALYNENNEMLLDMQVSKEMLSNDFVINAADKLTGIGELAGQLTELRHETLPDTASPYGLNILIGIILILMGIGFVYWRKIRMKKQLC
ncbi:processed acidic surface protein [Cytobacillus sp. Hz8]|uniref:processed acidic surface protein n=1 Tax=Cytobacillus sp. Hz8 TaxID=3347168 RepID=UPI0035E2FCEA